jgi:hypothetical protein
LQVLEATEDAETNTRANNFLEVDCVLKVYKWKEHHDILYTESANILNQPSMILVPHDKDYDRREISLTVLLEMEVTTEMGTLIL